LIRRVAAGIGMTVFDKLVIAGTQLVLVPVLASRWGLELYGQWLLLATLPQFLSMSDMGFATAAGTRMTMAIALGDRDEAQGLFQSAWRAILASSAVILVALVGAAWLFPASVFGAAELRLTFVVLAIYGVLAVQGSIVSAGLRAAGLFPLAAFWNAMVLLIENGALVATVLLGGGPIEAASAWLLGRIVGLAGQFMLLRRHVPWLRPGLAHGSWHGARALLGPAGAVMLLPASQALVLQGTALMVGGAAGQAAVPVFAAVRTLSRVGMQMCWIVSTPLMPELSAASARGERARMASIVLATLLFSALLVAPFALGFIVTGRTAVALWTGGAIVPPQALVAVMGLTVVLGGVWYPLSNLLLAQGRQASYTVWYLALAVASLPLTHGLAARLGATGGAIAMVAVDVAMLVVVLRGVRLHLASGSDLAGILHGWIRALVSAFVRRVASKKALP
jgi:O-antigen/teichoic acid export membrane protein